MSTDRPPLVDVGRLASRATIALLVAVDVTIVFASSRAPLRNPDTYFHLRFGEEFLNGTWSLAHPGQPNAASTSAWVPTQWLSQVVWAFVDDHAGAGGLAVLSGILVTAFVVVVYMAARTGSGPIASLVATTAVLLGSMHWLGLRPQVVSFVLTAATVLAWNRARVRRSTPWLLVPLTWVWAMCHGMWILGVAIGVVAAAALAIEQRDHTLTVRRLAVPLASLLVAGVTPVGPRLLGAVLLVGSRASHYAEWNPVPLLHGWGVPTAAIIGFVGVARMRRGDTGPFALAMLALAMLFAAYSGRTIVAALVVAAPLLAADLSRSPTAARKPSAERPVIVIAALVAVAASLVASTRTVPGLDADVRPFFPRLSALSAGTVVLTSHTYGAVLLWKYPHLTVPLHGYGDVFTDSELNRYDGLTALEPGWLSTLHDLRAREALLAPDAPLTYALAQRGWRTVQRAGDLELLVAPSPRPRNPAR